jgi:hypothetical protein
MKKVNTKKKSSAKMKLIPAAGSLMISAAMLSTSTYAWFTMSREVEVKNIRMTATTPEDIQISLGTLGAYTAASGSDPATYTAETSENGVSLGASTGILIRKGSSGTADDGNVLEPSHTWDWSNSADISAYYQFGRLMPASSADGTEIYFTPDANGVGKTVKANASYYQATDSLATVADGNASNASAKNKTYKTTLHAKTAADDSWNVVGTGDYTQASDWNKTFDDGYYVDIPIFLRTSSNKAVNLSVDGYVIPGKVADATNGDLQTQLELYRAVRVAFLDGEDVTATAADAGGAVACTAGDPAVAPASAGKYNNILPLKDAWSKDGTTLVSATPTASDTTKYMQADLKALNAPFSSTTSILDSKNYNRTVNGNAEAATKLFGVSALDSEQTFTDGSKYIPGTYSEYQALTPTGNNCSTVATIAGSTTGGQYGDVKKLIIRVWLDGEDGECWNDNAGQDWAISLKFSKIEATP